MKRGNEGEEGKWLKLQTQHQPKKRSRRKLEDREREKTKNRLNNLKKGEITPNLILTKNRASFHARQAAPIEPGDRHKTGMFLDDVDRGRREQILETKKRRDSTGTGAQRTRTVLRRE